MSILCSLALNRRCCGSTDIWKGSDVRVCVFRNNIKIWGKGRNLQKICISFFLRKYAYWLSDAIPYGLPANWHGSSLMIREREIKTQNPLMTFVKQRPKTYENVSCASEGQPSGKTLCPWPSHSPKRRMGMQFRRGPRACASWNPFGCGTACLPLENWVKVLEYPPRRGGTSSLRRSKIDHQYWRFYSIPLMTENLEGTGWKSPFCDSREDAEWDGLAAWKLPTRKAWSNACMDRAFWGWSFEYDGRGHQVGWKWRYRCRRTLHVVSAWRDDWAPFCERIARNTHCTQLPYRSRLDNGAGLLS